MSLATDTINRNKFKSKRYTLQRYRRSSNKVVMCVNTHLCSSLHKLLTPRRELMCGRIEREAGSQGKEQKHNNNFVVKTPREDGKRVTLCG